jgi:hypothetical protein
MNAYSRYSSAIPLADRIGVLGATLRRDEPPQKTTVESNNNKNTLLIPKQHNFYQKLLTYIYGIKDVTLFSVMLSYSTPPISPLRNILLIFPLGIRIWRRNRIFSSSLLIFCSVGILLGFIMRLLLNNYLYQFQNRHEKSRSYEDDDTKILKNKFIIIKTSIIYVHFFLIIYLCFYPGPVESIVSFFIGMSFEFKSINSNPVNVVSKANEASINQKMKKFQSISNNLVFNRRL